MENKYQTENCNLTNKKSNRKSISLTIFNPCVMGIDSFPKSQTFIYSPTKKKILNEKRAHKRSSVIINTEARRPDRQHQSLVSNQYL